MKPSLTLLEADRILRKAGAALAQGRHAQAKRHFEIIALRGCVDKDDSRQAARHHSYAIQGLGDVARALGDYPLARRQLNLGIRKLRSRLGPGDLAEAYLLNSLGMVGKYSGRFAEGTRRYLRALKIIHPKGKRSLDLDLEATLYHNLGGIEFSRGRFARAVPYARRSIALRLRQHGPRHPLVAADQSALAGALDGLGRFRESRPIYLRNIQLWKRLGRAHDYDRAIDLSNLAAIHLDEERAVPAARLFAEALKIQLRLFSEGHPDVALARHNLGIALARRGLCAAAVRELRAALRGFRKRLGASHPSTQVCAGALAELEG